MNFSTDLLPLFKKKEIIFKDRYKETGDIYTFIFELENHITWKAGQHGIVTIKHKKIEKSTRAFSIASTAEENHIKISMRISDNPSEYKKTLLELEPGMKLTMRGPIGSFYIRNNKPLLFVAGGIGITPYRAILKDLEINKANINSSKDIQLLYLDSENNFIYRDDLDELSKILKFDLKYISKRDDLIREVNNFVSKYNNNADYFVVGTNSMVSSIKEILINQKISKKNIIKDTFIGY